MVNLNRGILILLFSAIVTVQIVGATEPLVANFIMTPDSGKLPLTVRFTDTSTGFPTNWAWYTCPLEGSQCFGGMGPQEPPFLITDFSHTYTTDEFCNMYESNNIDSLNDIKVRLKVTNGSRTSEMTKTIHIELEPNHPVSSFTATPTSGPAPLTVQFTDTSSNNPTSWNWYFGEGKGSIGDENAPYQKNPSHTYTITGIHTVEMSAMGPTTCNPTKATAIITVFAPLALGTTTSPTLVPNQTTTTTTTTTAAPNTTITTAATTIPTTTVTTVPTTVLTTTTTAPVVTTYTTAMPTRSPTTKVTTKSLTPWPTNTPTQPSPLRVEIGIIAIIGAALLVMKRK